MNNLVVDPHAKTLPMGIHKADLSTLKKVFVTDAPSPEKRDQIFSAFLAWIGQIQGILPEFGLWVNGGFVTYKDIPPKDIDVVVYTRPEYIDAFPRDRQLDLLTRGDGTTRIQPMGGPP